jgi:hypothetical protein
MSSDLIISNLVTVSILGSCFLIYQYYKKYREMQYYLQLKEQFTNAVTLMTKGLLYYLTLKGYDDINIIKNVLFPNSHKMFQGQPLYYEPWTEYGQDFPNHYFPDQPLKFINNPLNANVCSCPKHVKFDSSPYNPSINKEHVFNKQPFDETDMKIDI